MGDDPDRCMVVISTPISRFWGRRGEECCAGPLREVTNGAGDLLGWACPRGHMNKAQAADRDLGQ